MAAKYQLMTELYRRTGIEITRNTQVWQNFLASACHNYKCRTPGRDCRSRNQHMEQTI